MPPRSSDADVPRLTALTGGATATGHDDDLVAQARRGDARAWAALCEEHFGPLYRHVGYLLHDPDLAQDVAQETFACALTALRGFDGRAAFRTWLKGIALNLVRKHWRTSARRDRALARVKTLMPTRDNATPDDSLLRRRRAEVLLAAVETLPGHLREAFVLLDLRSMSVSEAAKELGISPGNVRVRAARARARIRRQLAELGWLAAEDES